MSVTYTVTINTTGSTGNGAGFIDAKTIEAYGVGSATQTDSENKKRGNLRHKQIMNSIQFVANISSDWTFTPTGGSNTTEPSKVVYTFTVGDAANVTCVRQGTTYTGTNAVQQLVAEALTLDVIHRCDLYRPGGSLAITEDLAVGKLAADVPTMKTYITVA